MATTLQIEQLKLRQPSLPSTVTDSVINIYLDDAALEFEHFGINETDSAYNKMLSLYALHLMTVSGLIADIVSESVKDVSATYNKGQLKPGETFYYQEFMKLLRRRKFPPYILINS